MSKRHPDYQPVNLARLSGECDDNGKPWSTGDATLPTDLDAAEAYVKGKLDAYESLWDFILDASLASTWAEVQRILQHHECVSGLLMELANSHELAMLVKHERRAKREREHEDQ